MILQDSIRKIITEDSSGNALFVRNLIKEKIQGYILNFVFTNNKFNKLIFTGGTCLRKVYGLNRLSEDLDFDYVEDFLIDDFAVDVKQYFESTLQYKSLNYSISSNRKTVYFKFPVLKELNLYSGGTPEDIFVRCDFTQETKGGYDLDKNLIVAGPFQFFVTSYDLSTLFANKVVAFLERAFYKGKLQKIPFKGRDVYDLFWLVQLSGKSSYELKVNENRLVALIDNTDVKSVRKQVADKLMLLDDKALYDDLYPLLESKETLDGFIGSYKEYLSKYLSFVL